MKSPKPFKDAPGALSSPLGKTRSPSFSPHPSLGRTTDLLSSSKQRQQQQQDQSNPLLTPRKQLPYENPQLQNGKSELFFIFTTTLFIIALFLFILRSFSKPTPSTITLPSTTSLMDFFFYQPARYYLSSGQWNQFVEFTKKLNTSPSPSPSPSPSSVSRSLQIEVPSTYDLRKAYPDLILPAQNQMQCGTCSVFSVLCALADTYSIQLNKYQGMLSVQYLVDCYETFQKCNSSSYTIPSSTKNTSYNLYFGFKAGLVAVYIILMITLPVLLFADILPRFLTWLKQYWNRLKDTRGLNGGIEMVGNHGDGTETNTVQHTQPIPSSKKSNLILEILKTINYVFIVFCLLLTYFYLFYSYFKKNNTFLFCYDRGYNEENLLEFLKTDSSYSSCNGVNFGKGTVLESCIPYVNPVIVKNIDFSNKDKNYVEQIVNTMTIFLDRQTCYDNSTRNNCSLFCNNGDIIGSTKKYSVQSYSKVFNSDDNISTRILKMKLNLYYYKNLIVSSVLYDSFMDEKITSLNKDYDPNEYAHSNPAYAHAMTIIGWTETAWIVRNSWGTQWGRKDDPGMIYVKFGTMFETSTNIPCFLTPSVSV